jgi:hypothetical protein
MAAEITVERTHEQFTGKASSSEPQSATDRAASDTLEGLSQTQSHQVTPRHPGSGEQVVYAGDVEVGQSSTTSKSECMRLAQ